MEEKLMKYVKEGSVDNIKKLVSQGVELNYSSNEVLLIGVRKNRPRVVKYLIKQYAKKNSEYDYIVKKSLYEGNEDTLSYLTAFPDDIKLCHEDKFCIRWSLLNGLYEVFEYLSKTFSDIHREIQLALEFYLGCGKIELSKYLIENGQNIERFIDTGLIRATKQGDLEIIKYLIEKGADARCLGDYPLGIAAGIGSLELVKFFIEQGADVYANNFFAIKASVKCEQLEIIKYFISIGVNVDVNDNIMLFFASCSGNIDIIKYLISQGADIHTNNEKALNCAAYINSIDSVKTLLLYGADPFILKKYPKIEKEIQDWIKSIIKIQRACHNWLWAPVCRDGSTGLMARKNMYEAMELIK